MCTQKWANSRETEIERKDLSLHVLRDLPSRAHEKSMQQAMIIDTIAFSKERGQKVENNF